MSKGNEYSRLFVNIRIFLIGLIIFLSCSLPIVGGKSKIEKVTATMRPLSRSEIKELLERFPTVLNEALGSSFVDIEDRLKKDTAYKYFLDLGLQEFNNPLLKRLFPKAAFYSFQELYISGEVRPRVLRAVVGGKQYLKMPFHFNCLLYEHGMKLTDKNIIELAKAFVVVALEGQEVTFLTEKKIRNHAEAKKINKIYEKLMLANLWYRVYLKIKVGQGIQEWFFGVNPQDFGSFGFVTIGYPSTGSSHIKYTLPPRN